MQVVEERSVVEFKVLLPVAVVEPTAVEAPAEIVPEPVVEAVLEKPPVMRPKVILVVLRDDFREDETA